MPSKLPSKNKQNLASQEKPPQTHPSSTRFASVYTENPTGKLASQRTDGAQGASHSSLTSVTYGPSGMALSQTP